MALMQDRFLLEGDFTSHFTALQRHQYTNATLSAHGPESIPCKIGPSIGQIIVKSGVELYRGGGEDLGTRYYAKHNSAVWQNTVAKPPGERMKK